MICGNNLLFYNFSYMDYSTLSDGWVVGTIDLLKCDKGPHLRAFRKKTTWNLEVIKWILGQTTK